ncbi:MAG TPA: 2OG-Fe dioxygenase family protein [Ideonella sp.]|nr:2OG-Fe dioxygenase family protein [Ideonella sp.]
MPDSDLSAALAPEAQRVADTGFAFVPAARLRSALGADAIPAWPAFAASWDRLELDTYMADGGRYRRRRYATLSAAAGSDALALEPHQPHYQSLEYNRLNGGVARHFAPIEDVVLRAPTLRALLRLGLALFRVLQPGRAAHVEVHQFRIEARAGAQGLPTPEGAHRDGVDFVLVTMVRRTNVGSGTTEIFDLAQRPIDSFTLVEPGDAALVDDRRALHGVTPIVPADAARPAWRDVLVATYRAGTAGSR